MGTYGRGAVRSRFAVLAMSILTFILGQFIFGWMIPSSTAVAQEVIIYGLETCGHCQDAKEAIPAMLGSGQEMEFRLADASEHKATFDEIRQHLELISAVPVIIIGDVVVQGFGSIQQGLIRTSLSGAVARDGEVATLRLAQMANGEACPIDDPSSCVMESEGLSTWLLGDIDLEKLGLSSLSLILGFIDGFNPCAMWVLIMFLMALINIGDKKKMLIVAGTFIVSEALMYSLILTGWYVAIDSIMAIDFVGIKSIVSAVIGAIAVGAGGRFLYDWYTNPDATCQVGSLEQKRKISLKVKNLVNRPLSWAVFFGILAVALSVNIFEFVCSIGIPQTFTALLSANDVSALGVVGYMAMYIVMYMIDDVIVFGIAIYAFEKIGLTNKYARWSHFVGGLLMVILGLLFVFAPDVLVL